MCTEDLILARTSNYALRLPDSLKKAAEDTARKDGTTLNQFIVSAVAEKVSALRTADFFAERAGAGDLDAALRFLSRSGGEAPAEADSWPVDEAVDRRPD